MGKILLRKAIGALTTGLVLLAVGPVSAAVQLTAGVNTDGQGAVFTGGGTSSGAPISASVVGSGGFDGGSADATALIGVLGAEAHAQEFFFSNVFYDGSASYSDSVVFSGPGSDPISVQFNLHFGGSLAIGGAAAGAFADAHATINGVNVGDLHVGINDGVVERSTTFSGLGSIGTSYDSTLISLQALVPLNTPVPISLSLEVQAVAHGFNTSASSQFSNTFSFVTGGPLFNLPDGFTVNSPSSFIVDNRFTPPGEAVPEPSTLVISSIMFGLFGAVGLCKQITQRLQPE